MDRFHFSTAECFENCLARWFFRYGERLETLESDDPANALKIGTALHRGVETDVEKQRLCEKISVNSKTVIKTMHVSGLNN